MSGDMTLCSDYHIQLGILLFSSTQTSTGNTNDSPSNRLHIQLWNPLHPASDLDLGNPGASSPVGLIIGLR